MTLQNSGPGRQSNRYVGIVLAILSLLSIFAMLHHPSVSSSDIQQQVEELNRESSLNALVHGTLIAIVIVISFCLTRYAQNRNLNEVSILFGLSAYWLGTSAMVVAGLMGGFIIPQLAEIYLQASSAQLEVFKGLQTLSWLINQNFAVLGSICWCAAMFFWAFDMLKQDNLVRAFGSVTLAMGPLLALSLVAEWLLLTVNGMTLVMLVISVWQLVIAWLLIRQGTEI